LTLTDNGRGVAGGDTIESLANGRMGLAGMRERISALGGTVRIGNVPAGGLRLEVEVPRSE
ncbi:MAG: sensor histidine kinase, partial [Gemmatimonadales bacterium]